MQKDNPGSPTFIAAETIKGTLSQPNIEKGNTSKLHEGKMRWARSTMSTRTPYSVRKNQTLLKITPNSTRKNIRSTDPLAMVDIEEADVSGNEVAAEIQKSNFLSSKGAEELDIQSSDSSDSESATDTSDDEFI